MNPVYRYFLYSMDDASFCSSWQEVTQGDTVKPDIHAMPESMLPCWGLTNSGHGTIVALRGGVMRCGSDGSMAILKEDGEWEDK
jgi:hypothetical protein